MSRQTGGRLVSRADLPGDGKLGMDATNQPFVWTGVG